MKNMETYKVGDIILFKLDNKGIVKGSKFTITNKYYTDNCIDYFTVEDSNSKYIVLEEDLKRYFYTLQEHRKLIIENLDV